MLKTSLLTALTATTAIAQPVTHPTPPPPPRVVQHTVQRSPEFVAATTAYNQCLTTNASVPANVTPEAGAAQAVAACTTQRAALSAAFEAWVASPAYPASGRAQARTEFAQRLNGIPAQIAAAIARARSGPIAPPSPPATPHP